jgi:hypothetical protein
MNSPTPRRPTQNRSISAGSHWPWREIPKETPTWIDVAVDELLASGLDGLRDRIRDIIERAHAEGCRS